MIKNPLGSYQLVSKQHPGKLRVQTRTEGMEERLSRIEQQLVDLDLPGMKCMLKDMCKKMNNHIAGIDSRTSRLEQFYHTPPAMVKDVLVSHGSSGGLTDTNSASRRAEEASLRRFEAADWQRKAVGVVAGKDLPAEPSEEDFRIGLRSEIILCNLLNKIQPVFDAKKVERPRDSVIVPDEAALCAYQYSENVSNFLLAVKEMGLPSFEALELEQRGKSSSIVNCVLAIKLYSDWEPGGGNESGSKKWITGVIGSYSTKKRPNQWVKWLPWAEWWYNTSYHTATKFTPYEIVYGQPPPQLYPYEPGTTKVHMVDEFLKEREEVLVLLKQHLTQAQDRMKTQANKNRTEREFEVGDFVYLKVIPYKQTTMAAHPTQKLAPKYCGPFQILARIGKVAYKLQLPQIYNDFSSILEKKPTATLARRMFNKKGKAGVQLLIQWQDEDESSATWEDLEWVRRKFPEFELNFVTAKGEALKKVEF